MSTIPGAAAAQEMDLARIEEQLCGVADVVLVDRRSLRHVIRQHRAVSGVVPHGRCYAIRRAELESLDTQGLLRLPSGSERAWVLLVLRPSQRELRRLSPAQLHERVLRAAFHASVHRALELRALSPGAVRARVERIGRTEFEEIRATLAQDDLLLSEDDDREVYVEFCAVYLELSWFAPELLEATFPGLSDLAVIEEVVARDVDVEELLALEMPASIGPASRAHGAGSLPPPRPGEPGVGSGEARSLLIEGERAARRRDFGWAALFGARAVGAADGELREQALALLDEALRTLAGQLCVALRRPPAGEGGLDAPTSAEAWRAVLSKLVLGAARAPSLAGSAEGKALLCLQRATAAHERPGVIVDVPSWILSWGRRAVVRPRADTRELQILGHLQRAAEHGERIRGVERTEVTSLLQGAARRAEDKVRLALRPKIAGVLRQVGLSARSGPEQQARHQLVEELLDRIIEQKHLSLSQLRDAISRNEIKLPDLSGREELRRGDPLLLADAHLDVALDGIYRRGDVYLRVLQKLSSLPFGTRLGRILALYFAFPLVGAFVVLEGFRYLLGPPLTWVGLPAVDFLTWTSFWATASVIFCLLHSEECRVLARQFLEGIGVVFAWIFFRIPRALLTRPTVQQLLARPAVRSLIRCGLIPAALAALAYLCLPLDEEGTLVQALAALVTFASFSALLASPVGWWLENVAIDHLAPTWHSLSRTWIPQMLRLVGGTFHRLMDGLERGLSRIDDVLRFRRSESKALLVAAGIAGTLWAVVGYVIRLYVTLLVEPEINPLKHFPVVTVAHKVLLPFTPDLLRAFDRALSVFGDLVGGAVAGVTVFLLPSVFGFLVWELKENYRLYRATRSPYVPSARFGPRGETMQGLLVVGVHSGTLPKLYERLRRAAQRYDVAAPGSRRARREAVAADLELRRFRKRLEAVERSLRHFVQRELVYPLSTSPRWTPGRVTIGRIESSSNRVRIQLRCADQGGGAAAPDALAPCELTLEQLGGLLVASLSEPGFVAALDAEESVLFENALAVFYHRAQVELVREQVESELPDTVRYQVAERELVVWSGDDYERVATYPLVAHRPRALRPRVQGALQLPALDSERVLYSRQRILWSAWEDAWAAAAAGNGRVPRLLLGPSLLPVVHRDETFT